MKSSAPRPASRRARSTDTARESAIIRSILRRAGKIPGLLLRKRHGSGMGVTGDPDLYGSFCGRHVEIEVKRPGEVPSALQFQRLAEWSRAGAIAGWATSVDDFLNVLLIDREEERDAQPL